MVVLETTSAANARFISSYRKKDIYKMIKKKKYVYIFSWTGSATETIDDSVSRGSMELGITTIDDKKKTPCCRDVSIVVVTFSASWNFQTSLHLISLST